MTTKVGLVRSSFSANELLALNCLFYPYDVQIVSRTENADIIICRGDDDNASNSFKPHIRLPMNPTSSTFGFTKKPGEGGIIDLQTDVVELSANKLETIMNPGVSLKYTLATKFPYNSVVPNWIRSQVFRKMGAGHAADWDISRHCKLENCRRILLQSFECLGFELKKRKERSSPSRLFVTHDVDTERGLERATFLKSVENDLGVSSTWFFVSDEYLIPKRIAKELSDGSTIGSHDIKHDGRLIRIKDRQELVSRTKGSRERLESIFEREVKNFRSPFLQFSKRIVSALAEAGYDSDFSLPSWEPVHPSTMKGFGGEIFQSFEIGGTGKDGEGKRREEACITERPLTLFQDYQVLKILGLGTREAVKFWIDQAKFIRSFDGDLVLLVHPENEFSSDQESYRELLVSLLNPTL